MKAALLIEYDDLQIIPAGILFLVIIPKMVFTCSGSTTATAAIADAVTDDVDYLFVTGSEQLTHCIQFFHPNFGLYICHFHYSVLLLLDHDFELRSNSFTFGKD